MTTSVGAYLRELRERRGTPLGEIARTTRVAQRYLESLEADAFAQLPPPVFTRGYIRAYCQALGESPEEALACYDARPGAAPAPAVRPVPAMPTRAAGGGETRTRGALLASLILLVVLGMALFTVALVIQPRERTERAATAPAPPAPTVTPEPTTNQTAAPPTPPPVATAPPAPPPPAPAPTAATEPRATAAPTPSPVAPQAPPPAVVTPPRPAPAPAPVSPPAAPSVQAPAPANAPRPAPGSALVLEQGTPAAPVSALRPVPGGGQVVVPPAPPAQPPAATPPAAAPRPVATAALEAVAGGVASPYRLVARTSEATWIRVRTEDGRSSEENVPAGEVREWVSDRPFVLTVGNAGGVSFELNGRALPPLGGKGTVIPRLVLPPETR